MRKAQARIRNRFEWQDFLRNPKVHVTQQKLIRESARIRNLSAYIHPSRLYPFTENKLGSKTTYLTRQSLATTFLLWGFELMGMAVSYSLSGNHAFRTYAKWQVCHWLFGKVAMLLWPQQVCMHFPLFFTPFKIHYIVWSRSGPGDRQTRRPLRDLGKWAA